MSIGLGYLMQGVFYGVALVLLLVPYGYLYRGIKSTGFRLGLSVLVWGFLVTAFRSRVTNSGQALTLPGSDWLFDQRLVRYADFGVMFQYFAVLGGVVWALSLLAWFWARRVAHKRAPMAAARQPTTRARLNPPFALRTVKVILSLGDKCAIYV
jgi:hypothetical protein